jgi:hypothetical protein
MKTMKNTGCKFNLVRISLLCAGMWFFSNQTIAQGSFDQIQGSLNAQNEILCMNNTGNVNYSSHVIETKKFDPIIPLMVIAIDTTIKADFSWIKRYRTVDDNSSFKINKWINVSGINSNELPVFRSMPVIGLGFRFRIF